MVLALLPGMTNTFFTPILNAVEDVLSEAGYGLIIGDTRNRTEREAHYARLIRAGQVDGVILLTGHLPAENERAGIEGLVPTTLVCIDIPHANLPVFHVANRAAARRIVEYLIARGHRRIGHITGPKGNLEGIERRRGYKDALSAIGVPVDRKLVWQGDFMPETGSAAARSFLALADRPTAVFAANDETAVNFIRSVAQAGVRVPEDLSVVGFDDIEYLQLYTGPHDNAAAARRNGPAGGARPSGADETRCARHPACSRPAPLRADRAQQRPADQCRRSVRRDAGAHRLAVIDDAAARRKHFQVVMMDAADPENVVARRGLRIPCSA